jgi:hypothetical protein
VAGGVTEVSSGGVDYVIRMEPTGLMESSLPTVSSLAYAFAALRRLVRRDRTWTISDHVITLGLNSAVVVDTETGEALAEVDLPGGGS